jgi:hypothetical protein
LGGFATPAQHGSAGPTRPCQNDPAQMVQGTVFVAWYQMSSVQMKMVFVTQLVAGLRPTTPHVCHSPTRASRSRVPVCTAWSSAPRKRPLTAYPGSQVQGALLAAGSQAPSRDSSANVAACSPGAQLGCTVGVANAPFMHLDGLAQPLLEASNHVLDLCI